jgi:enterochelin esterase-like enzyme
VQVWRWLVGLSLTHGPLHLLLVLGALGALAGLLMLRRGRPWWTRRVPTAVLLAAGAATGAWLFVAVAKPWPDGLPLEVMAWLATPFLALALLGLGWRRQRWRVRGAAVVAAVVVVLGAADAIDTVYGAFPTVATAMQLAPHDYAPAAGFTRAVATPTRAAHGQPLWHRWHPPAALPQHGAVIEVPIPATRSRFDARPAWVYLPPAYLTPHRPLLPVLLMVGGEPGSPRDWLDGGQLADQMDQWAAAHGGLAPVVVMPDALGGETANPLCMDSARGRADTYLAQDVPAWVTSALQVDRDTAHWAVGGYSYGGTCALQLAVAHPRLFPTFLDISGQEAPTLGGYWRTVDAAFHGDQAAFEAVDPLHELAARRYPRSAGYLVAGAQDTIYRPQALAVAAAARKAGMSITVTELPGRHSWAVWRPALGVALPWLTARTGLAP